MDVYIGWPGSTHDERVLANSDIYIKGEAGKCDCPIVCEIHSDSFDDSWEVANPEDTRASSGVANQSSLTSDHNVWEALANYFATH